ncbi:unnamed protein product [Durusdinium trenchii]|uniref:General transcription and DNA repair factor IIH subunit TFB5 n=1 Tax=Durusdinium trenchii TaxID=1381693 RepID=A0ABP0QBY9_9DINO|eukprot:g17325.t1
MVREVSGILVKGDPSILTYIKYICQKEAHADVEHLDQQHVFCSGGEEVSGWLEEKIDAFVARNMLEPPEDTATFQGTASAPTKGKGKQRGQKRAASAHARGSDAS